MAAAIGFSAFVAGVRKMEYLNFKPCSLSTVSRFRVCSTPIAVEGNNSNLIRVKRGVSLNPRCCYDDARASSVSTLEQLKNSDVDRYSKEKSSIVVVGLSFRTAPVEMREKLAIPEAEWPRAIEELCGLHHIDEAAVLSTCNRMEIYVVALSWHRGVREVTEWMAKKSGIPVSELRQHLVIFRDKDATQHLFEVSSGLDSLVLGEGQIQSQVKQVRKVSEDVPGFGRNMDLLFKCAISVGARVRKDTGIATGAVSVSSAAVELALMKLPASSLSTTRVLVVGAGKMGKLVIRHLVSKGCTQMVVVNRSEEVVASIRNEFNSVDIIYKPLTEMFTCASEADVIFTSTASETPLFMKEHVEGLPPVGPNVGGIRLFIDISVPRNVGSCVSELDNAKVYNVDDLKEVVAANKEDRHQKAIEARVIISDGCKDFEGGRCSLETTGATIKLLRAHVEGIRVPEYEKCLSEIEKCLAKMGHDVPEKIRKAVESLSRSMMNKILHPPMQHLRCDGNRSQGEVLENNTVFNRVYGLRK